MKFKILLLAVFSILITACNSKYTPEKDKNSTPQDSLAKVETEQDSFPYPGRPIWGYRFVFVGDFDGDGQKDTLVERFINKESEEETNKFFSDLPLMEHQVYDGNERKVDAFLEDKVKVIGNLSELGQLGVYFGEVIGDIDENGTDEIGIVGFDAYPSNLNTYRIFSYDVESKKWLQLFDFGIREMSLPQLPAYNKVYGLFGSLDEFELKNEAATEKLEKALVAYKRVVKIAPKQIEFEGMIPNDLDYEFDEAFVFHEEYDNKSYWVTTAIKKTPYYIDYHRVLEKLFQPLEKVKGDTIQLEAAMEYIQQVKFK